MRIRRSLGAFRSLGILCAMLTAASTSAAAVSFDPDTVPEAYRASVAALTCPGATRAFQVKPSGDL